MALGTVTVIQRREVESQVEVVANVAVTSGANYTTGGEILTAAAFGLLSLAAVLAVAQNSNDVAKLVRFNPSNNKLLVSTIGTTPAEVASNSDQSAVVVRVVVRGN